jgi:hypothetical protein
LPTLSPPSACWLSPPCSCARTIMRCRICSDQLQCFTHFCFVVVLQHAAPSSLALFNFTIACRVLFHLRLSHLHKRRLPAKVSPPPPPSLPSRTCVFCCHCRLSRDPAPEPPHPPPAAAHTPRPCRRLLPAARCPRPPPSASLGCQLRALLLHPPPQSRNRRALHHCSWADSRRFGAIFTRPDPAAAEARRVSRRVLVAWCAAANAACNLALSLDEG